MPNILLETQYFPPIEYFSQFINADKLTLEACEHYQKGSYRNRCCIATSLGIQVLSVPLKKGKNSKMLIRDVAIAYDMDWQKQHWQSIRTAYGSAPFWEHYSPVLEQFFIKKTTFLFYLNTSILEAFFKILKLNNRVNVTFSNTYEINADTPDISGQVEGVDFRNKISPKSTHFTTKKYAQVFEDRNGFLPNLSILDAVLCCGPQTKSVLQSTPL